MAGSSDNPVPNIAGPTYAQVAAVVGYEADDALCAATAAALRARLSDIDADLPAALGLAPLTSVTPGGALDLQAWLPHQTDAAERKRRWTLIDGRLEPFMPRRLDGTHAPQCVLLVSAQRLLDAAQRSALRDALCGCRGAFSAFLVLFLIDAPDVRPLRDATESEAWLSAFAGFQQRVVLQLVTTTSHTGVPLHLDDVARLTADALTSDLVLPHRGADRVLTDRPEEPLVTLATFGGRAIELDYEQLATRLTGEFLAELLGQSVFHDAGAISPLNVNVPKPAHAVLSEITPADDRHPTKLELTPRDSEQPARLSIPPNQPVLIGTDFVASVDLGALSKQLHLDRSPRGAWLEHLHEWDVLLRSGIVPRLLSRGAAKLAVVRAELQAAITEYMAGAFARVGGSSLARPACEEVVRRIDEDYALQHAGAKIRSLGESLAAVERGLRQIPHGPSLLARSSVLILVLAVLFLLVWPERATTLGRLAMALIPLLALIIIAAAVWARAAGLARAQQARDQAVREAEQRGQLKYVVELGKSFAGLRSDLLSRAQAQATAVDRMCKALEPLRAAPATPPPAPRSQVLLAPEPQQDRRLFEWLFGKDSAAMREGDLIPRFLEALRAAVLEVVRDDAVLAALASEAESLVRSEAQSDSLSNALARVQEHLRAFAQNELLRQLRMRLQLWHLLRPDLPHEGFRLDAATAQHYLERLQHQKAVLCFPGPAVEEALLDPHHSTTSFVAPRVLQDLRPAEHLVAVDSKLQHVVMVLWRTELARAVCSTPTSGNGPAEGGAS